MSPLPSLPDPARDRIFVVHWSSGLVNKPDPHIFATYVKDWQRASWYPFESHLLKRRSGPIDDAACNDAEAEAQDLAKFVDLSTSYPDAWWLTWAGKRPGFGFPVVRERAAALDLPALTIDDDRIIDMTQCVWQAFEAHIGLAADSNDLYERLVPHGRLESLTKLHGLNTRGWLSFEDMKAYYETPDRIPIRGSVMARIEAIAAIFGKLLQGQLFPSLDQLLSKEERNRIDPLNDLNGSHLKALQVLRCGVPLTLEEIHDRDQSVAPRTLKSVLPKLIKRGLAKKHGGKGGTKAYYSITESGKIAKIITPGQNLAVVS